MSKNLIDLKSVFWILSQYRFNKVLALLSYGHFKNYIFLIQNTHKCLIFIVP